MQVGRFHTVKLNILPVPRDATAADTNHVDSQDHNQEEEQDIEELRLPQEPNGIARWTRSSAPPAKAAFPITIR
jgi:hypothetical protein